MYLLSCILQNMFLISVVRFTLAEFSYLTIEKQITIEKNFFI